MKLESNSAPAHFTETELWIKLMEISYTMKQDNDIKHIRMAQGV